MIRPMLSRRPLALALSALFVVLACDGVAPDTEPSVAITLQDAEVVAAAPVPVTISATDDRGLADLVVDWDDASADTVSLDDTDRIVELEHVYGVVGEYEISATLRDDGGQTTSATASLMVRPAAVAITTTPDTLNAIGAQLTLEVVALDAQDSVLDVSHDWTTSDAAIATVDGNGLVTAVAPGEARIGAAVGAVSDTVVVTVRQVPASIELSSEPEALALRETIILTAQVLDANGHSIPDATVTWATDAPNVVSASDGRLTGLAEGSAVITTTAGPATGTLPLEVLLMVTYVTSGDSLRLLEVGRSGAPVRSISDNGYYTPAWSPDASMLAYSGGFAGSHILVRNADGSDERAIQTGATDEDSPAWSPDGQRLAFVSRRDGDSEIFVIDLDGSNLVQLTDNEARDESPDWSPDGSRIAFHSDRDGLNDVFVMGADGADVVNLTADPDGFQTGPAWSPDGTQIAYIDTRDGGFDLHIMHPDGTHVRRVTDLGSGGEPAWSPDGDWIAFAAVDGGRQDLFVVHPDGTGLLRLTDDADTDFSPAWR